MTLDLSETLSLCPVCLTRIPAQKEQHGEDIYLVKTCPEHGRFKTLIWRGSPSFISWRRAKIPTQPPALYRQIQRGCPYDCGLCPDHRQRTCTAILEVTQSCNLACPICYADSSRERGVDPPLATISAWYRSVKRAGGECNIQLSGGEPTIREDLPEIVALGREHGFSFMQINTNGVRLAQDRKYVARLKQAGLSSVFLQFDGTDDRMYQKIRGQPLLADKLGAIEACAQNQIGVVLVPTVIPGVNSLNIGQILELAVDFLPTVRAVHFQPISYFGRYPAQPADENRMTLPELMRAVEKQSGGTFRVEHFRPPGCENSLCSFHGNFLVDSQGRVQSLNMPYDLSCCREPESADQGAARSIAGVARQWSSPHKEAKAASEWNTSNQPCSCGQPSRPIPLDDFLNRARTHTLSISAMAFQDAWNLDLDRVRDCCIHVVAENGDLIPFCLYNLTSPDGRRLYRPLTPPCALI